MNAPPGNNSGWRPSLDGVLILEESGLKVAFSEVEMTRINLSPTSIVVIPFARSALWSWFAAPSGRAERKSKSKLAAGRRGERMRVRPVNWEYRNKTRSVLALHRTVSRGVSA